MGVCSIDLKTEGGHIPLPFESLIGLFVQTKINTLTFTVGSCIYYLNSGSNQALYRLIEYNPQTVMLDICILPLPDTFSPKKKKVKAQEFIIKCMRILFGVICY